jgi:hypothetical protein
MLVWGSSGKAVDAGDAGTQHCEVCKESRAFRYLLTYKVSHIWYLIRWATSKNYYRTCQVCNNNFNSEAPVAASAGVDDGSKPKSPIPFFDRWGWAIGLGVVAALITPVVIAGNAEDAADTKLLANPQVGDRYAVEIEKFTGETDSENPYSTNYGVVRVSAVDDKGVTLDLPRMVWSKSSKLFGEIDNEARADGYYDGQIVKSRAELAALDKQGVIDNVER